MAAQGQERPQVAAMPPPSAPGRNEAELGQATAVAVALRTPRPPQLVMPAAPVPVPLPRSKGRKGALQHPESSAGSPPQMPQASGKRHGRSVDPPEDERASQRPTLQTPQPDEVGPSTAGKRQAAGQVDTAAAQRPKQGARESPGGKQGGSSGSGGTPSRALTQKEAELEVKLCRSSKPGFEAMMCIGQVSHLHAILGGTASGKPQVVWMAVDGHPSMYPTCPPLHIDAFLEQRAAGNRSQAWQDAQQRDLQSAYNAILMANADANAACNAALQDESS